MAMQTAFSAPKKGGEQSTQDQPLTLKRVLGFSGKSCPDIRIAGDRAYMAAGKVITCLRVDSKVRKQSSAGSAPGSHSAGHLPGDLWIEEVAGYL